MQIERFVRADFWEETLAKVPEACFFQTPTWMRFLTSVYPEYRCEPFLFRFEDGADVILPLVALRHGFWLRSYYSLPLGMCCGFVSAVKPGPARIQSMVEELKRRIRGRHTLLLIHPNPLSMTAFPNNAIRLDMSLLSLETGFDHIWENHFDSRDRHACEKADRHGVETRCDNRGGDIESFFRLYEAMIPPRDRLRLRFFQSLPWGDNVHVRLWTAHKEGRCRGGVLTFYYARHVTPFLHAYDEDNHLDGGCKLVYRRIIEDACARGFRYFSFMGPLSRVELGRPGKPLGCRRLPYEVYHCESRLGYVGRRVGRGLLRKPREFLDFVTREG